jgi:PAS domain S-box-containing protein
MDRKDKYPEIERRQDILTLAISQSSEGIAMVNLEGDLLYLNEAFAEMHGYAPADILGKNLSIFHTPEQMPSVDAANRQIKEKGYFKGEIWHKKHDGSVFLTMMHNSLIKHDNGDPVGMIATMRDLTEQKKAENELLKAKTELEEKVKERTEEINEKNITLKVLLDQRGKEKKQLEEVIMSNVKKLVMPNIRKLKNSPLNGKQKTALNILEANLNEIIFPFSSTIDSKYMKLTPTEIQVANHIKHGASSKEISESLALSQRTVDTHRYNIRKKLKISGKGVNLRTYLSSIQ